MKTTSSILLIALATYVTGCVPVSLATRNLTMPPHLKKGDMVEVAIDSAREVKFPAATKIDKTDGIVEFGNYAMSEMGITAQVRLKSESQIEINVRRTSAYISLNADKQADAYTTTFERHLKEADEKAK